MEQVVAGAPESAVDVHQGGRLAGGAFWQAEVAEVVGIATVGQAPVGWGRCSAEYVLRHGPYIFTILIVRQVKQVILWERALPAVLPSKQIMGLIVRSSDIHAAG